MKKLESTIASIILITMMCFPLFDMINGQVAGTIPVVSLLTQFIKFAVVGLLFLFFLSNKEKFVVLGAMGVFVVISIIHLLQPDYRIPAGLVDAIFFTKILSIPIYIMGFRTMFATADQIRQKQLTVLMWSAFAFYVVNIGLSIIGIGDRQYRTGGGLKGFFLSGNEFSLAYVLITAMIFPIIIRHKNIAVATIGSGVLLLLAVLIGFRTAMLGVAIIMLASWAVFAPPAIVKLLKKYRVLAAGALVVLVITTVGLLASQNFFERAQRRLNVGFWYYVLSDRNTKAAASLQVFSSLSGGEKLVGIGKELADSRVGKALGTTPASAEMDPVDLLLYGGILVAVVVYGVWLFSLYRGFSDVTTLEMRYLTIISMLLFVISCVTGHVIYSGIAIPYWGILHGAISRPRLVKV